MNARDVLRSVISTNGNDQLVNDGYAYVASPLTQHPVGEVVACHDASKATGWLMDALDVPAFSPVAHTTTIHRHYGDVRSDTHGFWLQMDEPLVRQASAIVVLSVPGWDVSYGISVELEIAEDEGLPAFLLIPTEDGDEYDYHLEVREVSELRMIIRSRRRQRGITT